MTLLTRTALAFAVLLAAGKPALAQDRASGTAAGTPAMIGYPIADGAAVRGYQSSDRQLAVWALHAWERAAAGAFRFAPADESHAVIRIHWVNAHDGLYGETMPAMTADGSRAFAVFVQPDASALGPEIAARAASDPLLRDAIVYLTCLHEVGHALGLSHTRDFRDIMYFFGYGGDVVDYFARYRTQLKARDDIAKVSGLSAGDERRIRDWR